jgi:dihydrofolate reductase
VISRQIDFSPEGVLVADSLDAALLLIPSGEDAYVIGGGEIYQQALPLAHCIELTRVKAQLQADTFFPEIDSAEWALVDEECHAADERHAYAYCFQRFKKRTASFIAE